MNKNLNTLKLFPQKMHFKAGTPKIWAKRRRV